MQDTGAEIASLKEQLGASLCIMGHHYQNDAVVRHCDITGDSLELARRVPGVEAAHIVFCGVYFMGESAALLAKPGQGVHLPSLDADCLMKESLVRDWNGAAVDFVRMEDIRSRINGQESLHVAGFECSGITLPGPALLRRLADAADLGETDPDAAVKAMDQWGIDCLVTGSQKGLMLPPGLALLALSPRAWKRAESVTPGCFYFNLPKERAKIAQGQTLFTSPVNLVVGLDESLDMLLENGLEAVYAKQRALTMQARAGVTAMGLELYAKTHFAWGITSVLLPEGIDGVEVLRIAMEKYGVCLAGGQDHMKGRMVRIGHMGWVDWADLAAGLYALNRGIIEAGGHCGSRDYQEAAMAAYRAALAGKPGQALPLVHS